MANLPFNKHHVQDFWITNSSHRSSIYTFSISFPHLPSAFPKTNKRKLSFTSPNEGQEALACEWCVVYNAPWFCQLILYIMEGPKDTERRRVEGIGRLTGWFERKRSWVFAKRIIRRKLMRCPTHQSRMTKRSRGWISKIYMREIFGWKLSEEFNFQMFFHKKVSKIYAVWLSCVNFYLIWLIYLKILNILII